MKKFPPILFVWVPLGLESGVRMKDMAFIYYLLVTLIALLMLEKILIRRL
jgi:hypothetical protein